MHGDGVLEGLMGIHWLLVTGAFVAGVAVWIAGFFAFGYFALYGGQWLYGAAIVGLFGVVLWVLLLGPLGPPTGLYPPPAWWLAFCLALIATSGVVWLILRSIDD